MDVNVIEMWLGTEAKLSPNIAEKMRGYIGNRFIEDSFLHNHETNGKEIYRYPMVQYKIVNESPLFIGIKDGVGSLWTVFDELLELKFDNDEHEVFEKKSLLKKVCFGASENIFQYSFLTPWLALNEKNYEKYQMLGGWGKRKELLEKILIGNIISMSKSLGYTVPPPIEANIHHLKEVKASLKGTPMLGFLGQFSVNFEIPDYWGIGKSVSRGFGTIRRV